MKNARHTRDDDPRLADGAVTLYVLPRPGQSSPGFCALVARALHCGSCAIRLSGPDGELVVDDAVGSPLAQSGRTPVAIGDRAKRGGARRALQTRADRPGRAVGAGGDATESCISVPLALPDGATGVITVADREDGTPFGLADRELLEHLVTFYAATYATPRGRETLRLRGDLRALRRQAIRAEESERQRLARDLHDDVGHELTTAILSLDMTAQRLPADNASREALAAAREALTACADHLHEFAFRLRPRVLNDLGLIPALRGLARRVNELGVLDAAVTVHGEEHRLGDDTELAAFRIVQEALTNALKHARATCITIDVTFVEGSVELEIRDNGVGFTPSAAKVRRRKCGQGLLGMRERAELAGGVLELQSLKGYGTTVWARLPIGEESQRHD